MDIGYIIIRAGLSIIFTALIYTVPIYLYRNKLNSPLDEGKALKNTVLYGFISFFIMFGVKVLLQDYTIPKIPPLFFWGFINYRILVKRRKTDEPETFKCEMCGYIGQFDEYCPKCMSSIKTKYEIPQKADTVRKNTNVKIQKKSGNNQVKMTVYTGYRKPVSGSGTMISDSQRTFDIDFGYSKENPIVVSSVQAIGVYLQSLRDDEGNQYTWTRNAILDNGINIYSVKDKDGNEKVLYFNANGEKETFYVPIGLNLDPKIRNVFMEEENVSTSKMSNKQKWIAGIAIVLVIILLGGNIFQYYENNQLIQENKTSTSKIKKLQKKVDERDGWISDYKTKIDNLQETVDRYRPAYQFYNAYAVIVLDDGTNYYHKFECSVVQKSDSDFWIYNSEAAESKGCKPCPKCQ